MSIRSKQLINTLTFPLRVVLSQNLVKSCGLNTLAQDRVDYVLPFVKGRLLDIGCGENLLVKSMQNGLGIDVYPWKGVDVICATQTLPLQSQQFDTVSLLACLNHIPQRIRLQVLKESHRALKPDGQLLITMINPIVGWVCHRLIASWDPDQTTRGMDPEEQWGLADSHVKSLIKNSGFKLIHRAQFGFAGLNTLYIAKKINPQSPKKYSK